MRWILVCGLAAACGRGPGPSSAVAAGELSNKRTGVMRELTVTRTHVGPIVADTPATLLGLRRALPGFEVRPANDAGLELRIYEGGEQLAYVVPDSQHAERIFNVHVTSARVAIVGSDWRVGAPFRGSARLTTCECWGDAPTCFRSGDHVAVNFERTCRDVDGGTGAALRVLDGQRISRIVWSPRPFGLAPTADVDDVHSYP